MLRPDWDHVGAYRRTRVRYVAEGASLGRPKLARDRSRQAIHISQSLNAPTIVFYRVSFDFFIVGFGRSLQRFAIFLQRDEAALFLVLTTGMWATLWAVAFWPLMRVAGMAV
jgi:hypothetical protein